MKWIFILLGVAVFAVVALFLSLAFMFWNHERGYPKAFLSEASKGICVVNKEPLMLLKTPRSRLEEDWAKLLPVPEGVDHYYRDYPRDMVLDANGKARVDVSAAIDIPAGTRFILKEGFKNRTINTKEHYYWLEPEGITLDSAYFYRSIGLGASEEEMRNFAEDGAFERACAD